MKSARIIWRLSASSLLLGAVAVGCTEQVDMGHPVLLGATTPKAERIAARNAAKAHEALAAHKADRAVGFAEAAVAAAPDKSEHRKLLGEAYLAAGRFASAEAALSDALTLAPNDSEARLQLGIAQAAQGHGDAARKTLAGLEGKVSPTNLGLALALAGDRSDAITMLAAAARAPGATPRTRQNLALTLALSGRWVEARAIAAQDVAPNELPARMRAWASVAQDAQSPKQIATILGVPAVADPGQPQRLALGSTPAANATVMLAANDAPAAPSAAAAPVAAASAPAAPAPIAVAEAAPPAAVSIPAPTPVAAPVEIATIAPPPAAAPQPAPAQPLHVRQAAADAKPMFVRPAKAIAAAEPSFVRPEVKREVRFVAPPLKRGGRFVVQLGAFARAGAIEDAWGKVHDRFVHLASYSPSSATIQISQVGMLHRLSIAGFATREDAVTVCLHIRAMHGKCFVREEAGDAPVQWVSRDKAKGHEVADRRTAGKPLQVASR